MNRLETPLVKALKQEEPKPNAPFLLFLSYLVMTHKLSAIGRPGAETSRQVSAPGLPGGRIFLENTNVPIEAVATVQPELSLE